MGAARPAQQDKLEADLDKVLLKVCSRGQQLDAATTCSDSQANTLRKFSMVTMSTQHMAQNDAAAQKLRGSQQKAYGLAVRGNHGRSSSGMKSLWRSYGLTAVMRTTMSTHAGSCRDTQANNGHGVGDFKQSVNKAELQTAPTWVQTSRPTLTEVTACCSATALYCTLAQREHHQSNKFT